MMMIWLQTTELKTMRAGDTQNLRYHNFSIITTLITELLHNLLNLCIFLWGHNPARWWQWRRRKRRCFNRRIDFSHIHLCLGLTWRRYECCRWIRTHTESHAIPLFLWSLRPWLLCVSAAGSVVEMTGFPHDPNLARSHRQQQPLVNCNSRSNRNKEELATAKFFPHYRIFPPL